VFPRLVRHTPPRLTKRHGDAVTLDLLSYAPVNGNSIPGGTACLGHARRIAVASVFTMIPMVRIGMLLPASASCASVNTLGLSDRSRKRAAPSVAKTHEEV